MPFLPPVIIAFIVWLAIATRPSAENSPNPNPVPPVSLDPRKMPLSKLDIELVLDSE